MLCVIQTTSVKVSDQHFVQQEKAFFCDIIFCCAFILMGQNILQQILLKESNFIQG
jgi:hypothetical protein